MNFEWKQIAERGEYAIGFVDVYELVGEKKAIAIIRYLPQHSETKQRVVFTLLLEGEKEGWTKGMISDIFEDAENRIKNAEYFKFNNFNSLDCMDRQIFTLRKIDDFDYLGHGDYNFLPENK